MTTTCSIHRMSAQRMRPLAIALAGLCSAAASFSHAAMPVAAADRPDVRALAERFGKTVLSARPDSTRAPTAVTNCNDSGPGSLRDAIETAVSGDTIDLTSLSCSRISLTTGAIIFGQVNLAIQGPGVNDLAIDGGLGGGALYHLGGGTLLVNDLSIENTFKYLNDSHMTGGCVHSEGNAVLTRVHLTNCNTLSAAQYAALGGAVWAQGIVQLDHSIVEQSMAKATGWGYASGGGVYALGGLVSMYSTVTRNVAIGESSTPSFGGGMFARGGAFILGTTVDGNQAWRMGGLALADNAGNSSVVVNSTISGNAATRVGGMYSRATLDMYNSTVAFNTSHEWTDGTSYFGAGVHLHLPSQLNSSILANNVNDGAPFETTDLSGDAGSGLNGGHNNVMFCGAPCPNDTSHEDPGLHPLQDNGGLTRTHVPTPGIWDTFGGTNLANMQFDQRGPGFPRQSPGDFPEIGALQINSDIIFANGFN